MRRAWPHLFWQMNFEKIRNSVGTLAGVRVDDEAVRKEVRRGDVRFARLSHQGGVRATLPHRCGECLHEIM